MVWDSVAAGLKILTYWETYVAGLEYLAIYIIPTLIIGKVMENNEGGAGMAYLGMLLIPLMQVAALVVFILTLATIIFGFTDEAAWAFPWDVLIKAPTAFFILVGALVIVAFVLSFIPFIGRLHSLQTLVLGGLALIFVLSTFDSVTPGQAKVHVNFVPDFWFAAGLIVIGGFMSWIGTLVSALIVGTINFKEQRTGQYILIPISAIFGFIPLFMYGAWLGAQVKGGF
jgi:hypothetical protein